MKLNLKNEIEAKKAKTYLLHLIEKGEFIELRKIAPKRSNQQNRYLHLLLGMLAIEYGDTLEYVKTEFYKKKWNPDIFCTTYTNPKTGEIRDDLKSSASLDTKELNISIERLRTKASQEMGIYLPDANEHEFLKHIEKEIDKYAAWI